MNQYIYNTSILLRTEKSAVNRIEPLLFEMKELLSMNDEKFYNLVIAITEGINNAVMHGNKLNPEKSVNFRISADEKEITVVIEDQGEGFNPDNVEDPRTPENLMKDSGRGIFLIRALMNQVNYQVSPNGTKLIFKCKL